MKAIKLLKVLSLCISSVLLLACQKSANPSPSLPSPGAVESTSVDRTCRVKGDCAQIISWYIRDDVCCRSCDYDVLAVDAAKKEDDACRAMGSEGCPMKKCVAPPDFDCVENVCTNLPGE